MDERHRRISRRALVDPDDEQSQERVHHNRLRRGDHEDYAKELRKRVNEGDTHHTTIRRYIETLHRAHPEIVEHFNKWAHHKDAQHKHERGRRQWARGRDVNEINRASTAGKIPHYKEANYHEGEANSARRKGEEFSQVAGHRAVYFLKPRKTDPPSMDESTTHLSRLHDLASASWQGSARYHYGTGHTTQHHDHDEWPSPEEAHETARIHEGVVKYHFPNAKTEVRGEGPNGPEDAPHDRHSVHISNTHDLKTRAGD